MVPPLLFFIAILVIWEAVVLLIGLPEYLLPAPSKILARLAENADLLMTHAAVTMFEAATGFVIGAIVGILLSIVFVHSKTLELSIYPYAIGLKSVPIVAIAPLLVVWLGNGLAPKVIVAAIISFFPVVVNTTKGLRAIDPEALDLFDLHSATKFQVFLKLRLPFCLPYLFAGLRISATLAVIGAIVGEFAGANSGLGFFILVSSHRLETVDMFVGIVLSALLGIGFFYLISMLEMVLIPRARRIDRE